MSSQNSEEKSAEKPSTTDNIETPSSSSSAAENSGLSMSMEQLRRYLAEKLGFHDEDSLAEREKVKILDNVNLDGIVEYIKKNNCRNIITMAGAGISTSAGIPDFRTPGTGLYDNLQKYNLPHPQAIFELDFFHENPKPFFVLAKELYPGSFKPTVCHYFIKMLAEKELLLRHYTQNIDTLERVAGIPDDKIVEAHGTFYTGHCLGCNHEYTLNWMKERIFKDEIPICEKCPDVVKPDIVFFGENLPDKFHKFIGKDFPKCDLLIVLGSSLVVQPFASLIDRVEPKVPRLLINHEKAGHQTGIMSLLGMSSGMDFDSKDNSRDVFWRGDCDTGCQLLADKLGWGDQLREMVKTEHELIDQKNKNTAKLPESAGEKQSDTKSKENPKEKEESKVSQNEKESQKTDK